MAPVFVFLDGLGVPPGAAGADDDRAARLLDGDKALLALLLRHELRFILSATPQEYERLKARTGGLLRWMEPVRVSRRHRPRRWRCSRRSGRGTRRTTG